MKILSLIIGIVLIISSIVIFFMQSSTTYPLATTQPDLTILNRVLPNRTLAPGDVLTKNLTIICVTGYSSTVRDVPLSLRKEIFARDGYDYEAMKNVDDELDHIIPLCLGGSNDEDNLFVQLAEPRPGYKEKDKLENYLCDHVCSGEIDITYAQFKIAEDWYSYYLEIYG